MAEVLNCEKREVTGTLRNRRLRKSGFTPAVLYGRGDNVNLSIPTRDIEAAVRHGSQIVELKGGCNESAMILEVQWDAFGIDVLHIDLTRIDASEVLQLTLPVELVGVAPGTRTGGMVKQLVHEVEIECKASAVPEKLELKINDLELDGTLMASDIPLDDGVKLVTDAETPIVQCVEVVVQEEPEAEEGATAAEPEVIGRSAEGDEEGGDSDD